MINIKILSIVGTRPQFIKMSPLSDAFDKIEYINHIVVHTGQHFDNSMSDDQFTSLRLKSPDYNLNVNCKSSSEMVGRMMIGIEKILILENPDYVLVYGDCDTTVAGALVAKKLCLYLVHIEAGLRSFNRSMPEEINRVTVDHISDTLCCPTVNAVNNLRNEGIVNGVHLTGNLQIDLLKNTIKKYNNKHILNINNLEEYNYALATIHRKYNTNEYTLTKIIDQLGQLGTTIIFPIHPRTRDIIKKFNIKIPNNVRLHEPVNYPDMTILERYSSMIVTDSGGIQIEAWFLKKICVVVRSETEWVETVQSGNSVLFNINSPDSIRVLVDKMREAIDTKPDTQYKYNCSDNIIKLLCS